MNQIEMWHIDKVHPYENNPKLHSDEAIEEVVVSIREYGWTYPILVDENGEILAGHRRLAAAKAMSLVSVPVLQLSGLTQEKKRAYRLADNKIAERTIWDVDLVNEELSALMRKGFDLNLTGFTEADLLELEKATTLTKLAEPPKISHKDLLERKKAVRAILFVDEIYDFEEALRRTNIKNRGEAIHQICKFYLENNDEERQLNDILESLSAV